MPYIDSSIVERVKRIDLLTYLREREPHELVRVSSQVYSTREHDSLKISNGKWYWWSRGIGGRSALDFLIKVRGMSFVDAVSHLDGSAIATAPRMSAPTYKQQRKQRGPKEFELPPANANVSAMRYLKSRGISQSVLDECFDRGLIFGTFRKGKPYAVFVGNDEKNIARYAALRACDGDFKGEIKGSDKRYSFRLVPKDACELHVCESAIDALSLMTINEIHGFDWSDLAVISLGGVAPSKRSDATVPEPLDLLLKARPDITQVFLHLDNDDAGTRMAEQIKQALDGKIGVIIQRQSSGKDLNDHLMNLLSRSNKGRER